MAADFGKLRDQISGVLTQHTDKTMTDLPAIEADVAQTLSRGFAYDSGEFRDRIVSFGAAILLPNGEPVGALGISLPDMNLPDDGIERYGGLVIHAARSVSSKLGRI